jgi:hypothetical protein
MPTIAAITSAPTTRHRVAAIVIALPPSIGQILRRW